MMSIDNLNTNPVETEQVEVNPEDVSKLAAESLELIEQAETESQAIDCMLNVKMQCFEQSLPFDEVQSQMVAGLGSTTKSIIQGVIRGTLSNPQGLTEVSQLLT